MTRLFDLFIKIFFSTLTEILGVGQAGKRVPVVEAGDMSLRERQEVATVSHQRAGIQRGW